MQQSLDSLKDHDIAESEKKSVIKELGNTLAVTVEAKSDEKRHNNNKINLKISAKGKLSIWDD